MLNVKLFNITFVIYLIGIIVFLFEININKKYLLILRRILFVTGWVFHLSAWFLRWYESGFLARPPFINTYETLIFFAWIIILFSFILEIKFNQKLLVLASICVAILAFGAASVLPETQKESTPLMPALQSYWLYIHILTCFIAYAGFAISFVAGLLYVFKKNNDALLELFDKIQYKSIVYSFPFLSFGIISGSIWANYAWGTYWGWDPKETWSLITWFIYAAYLHLRILRGWKQNRIAWVSIIGFMSVLFTYFGVNYLLSGLHSYM